MSKTDQIYEGAKRLNELERNQSRPGAIDAEE